MVFLYVGMALLLSVIYVYFAMRLASGKKPGKMFGTPRTAPKRPRAAR